MGEVIGFPVPRSQREEIADCLVSWVENGRARRFVCVVESQEGEVLTWAPQGALETVGLLEIAKAHAVTAHADGCYASEQEGRL